MENAGMKEELKILLDRLEKFGAIWMTDENGSYDEDFQVLFCSLSDAEAQQVYDAERRREQQSVNVA
jgi:hypothetical protein